MLARPDTRRPCGMRAELHRTLALAGASANVGSPRRTVPERRRIGTEAGRRIPYTEPRGVPAQALVHPGTPRAVCHVAKRAWKRFHGASTTALSSDQRACSIHRPLFVLLLPCSFHSARRTSSTAWLASWQTWKGSNTISRPEPLGALGDCADRVLVAGAHVDRDRLDGVAAVTEQLEERLQGGGVAAGFGPYDRAALVVGDAGEVALPAPVGDLVHADQHEPVEAALRGGDRRRPG